MAACRTLLSRGVLTLGLHYQHVCRSVLIIPSREKKRWMKAYTLLMDRKRKLEGAPPVTARSVCAPVPAPARARAQTHTHARARPVEAH